MPLPPHPTAARRAQPARVRWWAAALVLAVFTVLLCLLASPARAGETHHGPLPYGPGLHRVVQVLLQVVFALLG